MLLVATIFFVAAATLTEQTKVANCRALASSDGAALCAVGEPAEVRLMPAGSYVQCGIVCINQQRCKSFNFNSLLGKCDLFNTVARNATSIPGCVGYIVIGEFTSVSWIVFGSV